MRNYEIWTHGTFRSPSFVWSALSFTRKTNLLLQKKLRIPSHVSDSLYLDPSHRFNVLNK